MGRFVARRLAQAAAVVLAVYTLTFAVFYLLPADPVRIMIGPENGVDEARVSALRAEYGLDRPAAERYIGGLLHALHGDFGTSFQTGREVGATIAEAAPRTLALAGGALLLALPLGFLIAWWAAHTRRMWLRRSLGALPGLSLSVPTFWLGLVLLQAFSFGLPLFPARAEDGLAGLVLPAVTLAVPSSAFVAQVLLERLTVEMRQPYVDTARAKGASRARAVTAHALRNAAMPALTMTALLVGWLVSGSVVVETVFARNGLGRLIESAVTTRDLPMLQALVVVTTAVVTLLTLAVDVAHPLVDPRLRERAA
ncbi:ABC transporter permease [Microbispora hainanensis]|jgi:peptide/nickel transport system permease protein|uniref:ABC transporter permease n=1 Tax=Microbispora hainanensis TaxID=568844 RepID=A0ABZ1SM96_9ACTN|nr:MULTISPECIES: ABC transporter permease [Microbispora]GGO22587.1 peptide ABC transporter permease [Microbispora rosea subsp. aerata]GIH57413.1 peptide ABC transporter permease [Microbispora rosea subsp. aerata]GLJ86364.1 peptide ABC transporter permease [Microbispora rosea subsp. aerata]